MILIVLNTLVWFVMMAILGLLKFMLPFNRVRDHLDAGLDFTLNGWVGMVKHMATLLNICKIEVTGVEQELLDELHWYVIVCNHQSWADILILQNIFWRKIPPLKFFTKKQLLYVPFLGTAMWIQDFPYVHRHSAKKLAAHPELATRDKENTRKACEKFGKRPTSVLNFLEGTRFTPPKHVRFKSTYNHLLNPKLGGFGVLAEHLGHKVDKIIDVTILYPPCPPRAPGFFDYLTGQCKSVKVEISCHDLPASLVNANFGESEALRAELKQWINAQWQRKDERLIAHYAQSRSVPAQVTS